MGIDSWDKTTNITWCTRRVKIFMQAVLLRVVKQIISQIHKMHQNWIGKDEIVASCAGSWSVRCLNMSPCRSSLHVHVFFSMRWWWLLLERWSKCIASHAFFYLSSSNHLQLVCKPGVLWTSRREEDGDCHQDVCVSVYCLCARDGKRVSWRGWKRPSA